ncbi:MAG: hypothetical protein JST12_11985 [Armatimonadetes bacterium]|nr:hypothetical protein [Armatimonadota bacterium]
MRTRLAPGLGLLLASMAKAQSVFGDQYQAYMLMPTQPIAGGKVTSVELSPSGNLIVYRQESFGGPESLLTGAKPAKAKWFAYDRRTKMSHAVAFPGEPLEVIPMGDDRTVFFRFGEHAELAGAINTESGRWATVDVDGIDLSRNPRDLQTPFLIGRNPNNDIVLISTDGTMATIRPKPAMNVSLAYDADGGHLYFYGYTKLGDQATPIKAVLDTKAMSFDYFGLKDLEQEAMRQKLADLRGRFMTTKSNSVENLMVIPPPQLKLVLVNGTYVPADVKPISDTNRLLPRSVKLGPVEGEPKISAQSDFVVYFDGGALLMREIKPISLQDAEKQAFEDVKAALLDRAKGVGYGFRAYAADCDGDFPDQKNWENTVNPYFKNRGTYQDFNYAFKGGSTEGIDQSTTELGFFMGPGGRAVVYLDGNTKWIPNP